MNSETFYDHIQLASDEWGNDKMREVAEEHFRNVPECNYVLVYEHAGWRLGFRRDMSCWDTANDMAVVKGPFPSRLLNCIDRNHTAEEVMEA